VRFVLEASVTLSWLLRDTSSRDAPYAFAVLNALRLPGASAEVPVTWGWRSRTSSLAVKPKLRAQRPKRSFPRDAGWRIDQADAATSGTPYPISFARRYHLSSYNASYLELALRSALPLATLDEDLRRAASKAGVEDLKLV